MIAIDLSKQQINFTTNFDRARNTRFYFILEEAKETVFEFSQGTVKGLEHNFIKYSFIECKVYFNFYHYKNDTIQ